MESLVGKWIVTEGNRSQPYMCLSRLECLFVYKETNKTVKCAEGEMYWGSNTIQKSDIIKIIDKSEVEEIREHAMNVKKEYEKKAKELFEEYKWKMLNFPRRYSEVNKDEET